MRFLINSVCLLVVSLVVETSALASEPPLVLWHSYRGVEEEALKKVLVEYERQSGEHVRLLGIPYDAFASKLTTAIPRNNGPDLFVFAHERLGAWADASIIASLDSKISPSELSSFFEATVEPLRYRNQLYGLPLAFKSLVLYYNKELVASPPRTTDELFTLSRQMKQQGLYGLAYQSGVFYFHAPWYFGFGGRLHFGATDPGFASKSALASFDFVQTLVAENWMPDEVNGALVTQLFNSRKTATVINGPWFLGEIDSGVNYGIAPLPIVSSTGKRATPFLTDEAIFVSAKSSQVRRSVALARFLAGDVSATIRAEVGKQLVANKRVWKTLRLQEDPVLGVFAKQLKHVVPMHNGPEMQSFWEPGDLALKKVLRGTTSVEESAMAANRRYAAITGVRPDPTSPKGYGIGLAFVLVGVLAWLVRNCVNISRNGEWNRFRQGWSWVFPGMVALTVLVFVPFVVSLGMAFFSHRAGEWTFVGFGNFVGILHSKSFGILEPLSFYYALVVTVAWTALNLMLHVGVGGALALLLNQRGLRLRALYRVILIVPWAVPNYITALIWKGMFHRQYGTINAILETLGVDGISWFSSFGTAFFANICTNAWLGFPFIMVVCLGGLQSIPDELYDAADVDGAGVGAKLRLITLPLLKPAVLPAILLGIVWTFNQFNIVYLVSRGEPDNSTDILISEVYRWAFARREQYGYAAAYAGLVFILLVGWSIWSTRLARRVEDMV